MNKSDNINAMKQKLKLSAVLIIGMLFLLPTNVFAIGVAPNSACSATGGMVQKIKNSDGTETGNCIYWGVITCNSYNPESLDNHCTPYYFVFGSLNWWPTRIVYLLLITLVVYKISKRKKIS